MEMSYRKLKRQTSTTIPVHLYCNSLKNLRASWICSSVNSRFYESTLSDSESLTFCPKGQELSIFHTCIGKYIRIEICQHTLLLNPLIWEKY